jgi:hypothetical protein
MRGINHSEDWGRAALVYKGGGGSSGGGSTLTTTQSHQPPPQFVDALSSQLGQVQQAGAAPYQNYPGSLQAPFSPQQLQGFDLTSQLPGLEAPYLNAASQHLDAATTPLLPQLQPYLDTAQGYFGQAAGANLPGAVQPFSNQAGSYFNQAGSANLPGAVAPTNQQAAGLYSGTTGNIDPTAYSGQAVSQYFNPYVQNVVNATQAQFANQNAIQANQLRGQAASQGALGGDRAGVAQGVLAGQQQLAQAPVLAGLYSQGFGQAQQEFNTQQQTQLAAQQADAARRQAAAQGLLGVGQQNLTAAQQQAALQQAAGQGFAGLGQLGLGAAQGQAGLQMQAGQGTAALGQMGLGANEANAWLNSQAASGYGNLGQLAQSSTLQDIQALMGAGGQQQQQAQQGLNIPFEQFLAAQAYPFQTTGWESGVLGQLANAAGGTSTLTQPGPSPYSQIGGVLTGAAGLAGAANSAGLFGGGNSGGFSFPESTPASLLPDASSGSLFDALGSNFTGGGGNPFEGGARGGAVRNLASGGSTGPQVKPATVPPPWGGFGTLSGKDDSAGDALDLPPDVSISVVPPPPVPGISSAGQDTSSTSMIPSGSGGGSGLSDAASIIGGIGKVAGLAATLIALERGGRIPRRAGGGATAPVPPPTTAPSYPTISITSDTSPKTGFAVPMMQVGSRTTSPTIDALNNYLTTTQAGAYKPPPMPPPAVAPAPAPAPAAPPPPPIMQPADWWNGPFSNAAQGGEGGAPEGVGAGGELGGAAAEAAGGGANQDSTGAGSSEGFGARGGSIGALRGFAIGGRPGYQAGGDITDMGDLDPYTSLGNPNADTGSLITNRPIGSRLMDLQHRVDQNAPPMSGSGQAAQKTPGERLHDFYTNLFAGRSTASAAPKPASSTAPAPAPTQPSVPDPSKQVDDFFNNLGKSDRGLAGFTATEDPNRSVGTTLPGPGLGSAPSPDPNIDAPAAGARSDVPGQVTPSQISAPDQPDGRPRRYADTTETGDETTPAPGPGLAATTTSGGLGQPSLDRFTASDIQMPKRADPWLALADAGFSMAAGTSPFPLVNIGAGAKHGLETYMSHEQAADKLMVQVQEAKARIADTAAWRQTMGNVNQQKAATGQQRADTYARWTELRDEAVRRGQDMTSASKDADRKLREELGIGNLAIKQGTQARIERQGNERIQQGWVRLMQGADNAEKSRELRRMGMEATADAAEYRALQHANDTDILAASHLAASPKDMPAALAKVAQGRATQTAPVLARPTGAQATPQGGQPPDHDVALLKQDHSPQRKAQFDQVYGQGAADRALAAP